MTTENKFRLLTLVIIILLAIMNIENTIRLERLGEEIERVTHVNDEQQAFIRNQRNEDQDIWDMLNQHSEHIGLIWERIP